MGPLLESLLFGLRLSARSITSLLHDKSERRKGKGLDCLIMYTVLEDKREEQKTRFETMLHSPPGAI